MPNLTPFQGAIEALKPDATGSDLVQLLDGKVKRTTALEWKAGRVVPPQWALQLLATKIHASVAPKLEAAAIAENQPERIGKRAGTLNIRRYNARRNQSA